MHLTARGNARADIFADDEDRQLFLDLLGKEIQQQGWRCYAYCLMDNHYHLLRRAANLPLPMAAECCEVSPSRISKIQHATETSEPSAKLRGLLERCNVKN